MENSHTLDIVVESNIPFIKGTLEHLGRVRYLAADEITAESVADADALFVRTRTRCDSALLRGSKCRFIATATIGTDHIDLPWCEAHGITVANAPGCNAPAVAQYVFASIHALTNRPLHQYTLGIVGVGHVGSIVERWARQMDMRVLVNDPPRQINEGGDQWSSLDDIARQADIITLHTPLDATTRHLADERFFGRLRRSPIIINAARGGVIDDDALVQALDGGRVHHAIIDCWENEPAIKPELLERAAIATPHIAGYSYEGKVRATQMVLDAFCHHFGFEPVELPIKVPATAAPVAHIVPISLMYDPMADTRALKAHPESFEALRNNYNLRHELPDLRRLLKGLV